MTRPLSVHFLFLTSRKSHRLVWFAWIGDNQGDANITLLGENLGDNFVTFYFTQFCDFLGDLPELVKVKVTMRSPYLMKMRVTILLRIVSPSTVNFLGICRNWWELRWLLEHFKMPKCQEYCKCQKCQNCQKCKNSKNAENEQNAENGKNAEIA